MFGEELYCFVKKIVLAEVVDQPSDDISIRGKAVLNGESVDLCGKGGCSGDSRSAEDDGVGELRRGAGRSSHEGKGEERGRKVVALVVDGDFHVPGDRIWMGNFVQQVEGVFEKADLSVGVGDAVGIVGV